MKKGSYLRQRLDGIISLVFIALAVGASSCDSDANNSYFENLPTSSLNAGTSGSIATTGDVPASPVNSVTQAVDPACTALSAEDPTIPYSQVGLTCARDGNPSTVNYVYPPLPNPLPANTVPDACLVGFEINNLTGNSIVLNSNDPAGSAEIMLEIDIATYVAPDDIKLTGTLASGETYDILDSCRMRTACYSDPTNGGLVRPPEDSIRPFRATLRAGTVSLTLNDKGASTPNYERILGLCDFNLSALKTSKRLRLVNSR